LFGVFYWGLRKGRFLVFLFQGEQANEYSGFRFSSRPGRYGPWVWDAETLGRGADEATAFLHQPTMVESAGGISPGGERPASIAFSKGGRRRQTRFPRSFSLVDAFHRYRGRFSLAMFSHDGLFEPRKGGRADSISERPLLYTCGPYCKTTIGSSPPKLHRKAPGSGRPGGLYKQLQAGQKLHGNGDCLVCNSDS